MEEFKGQQQEKIIDEGLRDFVRTLSEITSEDVPLEYVEGTYEIEADSFMLTFTLEENIFEIRSIDVHGNGGLGGKIIHTIHEYVDEHGLEVVASNVRDTAIGFWVKMGYQEGETEGEYFRVT